MELKALGVYAGIGAMLIAFQRSGWRVLGNIEDRKIHTFEDDFGDNTFTSYFDAPILPVLESLEIAHNGIDLIAAQPKCGGFSQLFGTGRKPTDAKEAQQNYGKNILTTIGFINRIHPRFFYFENLPKSLLLITPEMWKELLPDYNLQFEWVSNYGYGNPQKGRDRLYVIGCNKDEDFIFIPRETRHGTTVKDRIGDIRGHENRRGLFNHEFHSRQDTDNITNLAKSNEWKMIAEFVLTLKEGENLPYRAKDGDIKRRIGSNKLYWDKHSHTLAGIKGAKFHPITGYPISIRERCRLQGYPDDFIIKGTHYNSDGTWTLRKNSNVVRQLNNTIPYEFTEEFARQLNHYIKTGDLVEEQAIRSLKPNPIIERARSL